MAGDKVVEGNQVVEETKEEMRVKVVIRAVKTEWEGTVAEAA